MMYKQNGFTLLEVLLAVSITALIGIGASQLLSSTIATKQSTEARSSLLNIIQKADVWLKRDMLQIAPRKTRDQYGDLTREVQTEGDYLVELSHSGQAIHDFVDSPRSNLQRVAYLVASHESDYCERAIKPRVATEEGNDRCFVRLFWRALDKSGNDEPVVQVLIDGVKEVRFQFRGQMLDLENPNNSIRSDDWQEEWPSPYAAPEMIADLAQVKVIISTAQYGDIERIYEVPRYAFAQ